MARKSWLAAWTSPHWEALDGLGSHKFKSEVRFRFPLSVSTLGRFLLIVFVFLLRVSELLSWEAL